MGHYRRREQDAVRRLQEWFDHNIADPAGRNRLILTSTFEQLSETVLFGTWRADLATKRDVATLLLAISEADVTLHPAEEHD